MSATNPEDLEGDALTGGTCVRPPTSSRSGKLPLRSAIRTSSTAPPEQIRTPGSLQKDQRQVTTWILVSRCLFHRHRRTLTPDSPVFRQVPTGCAV